MARDMTGQMLAAIQDAVVRPVGFFEGEFATGFVRFWSGYGEIQWDGKTWTGSGNFGGVSSIDETADVRATGFKVTLSGIPASMISAALGEARQGKVGRIFIGAFTEGMGALLLESGDYLLLEDGGKLLLEGQPLTLIPEPILAAEGRLDVPEILEGAETSTIGISYEGRLVSLKRPRERRYTDEDQRNEYPGDLGFEYVDSIQEWSGVWGRA